MVYHHLGKFRGHSYASSKNIMFLVCHVIKKTTKLKGQVSKSLKVIHHPTKFGNHRHCGIQDIILLVCHVTSQDHLIKESRTL